jgi:UDP-3-O-acyl N-acetylglucosamine deacetylase
MMRQIGQRLQRTLARPVTLSGVAYLTGDPVSVTLLPAEADAGITFLRTDSVLARPIPAVAERVTSAQRRTVLGRPPEQVEMVEHLLAALAGLKIDNVVVEVDGPELPALDGSAFAYLQALDAAGVVVQQQTRGIWTVERPYTVTDGKASLTLHPATAPGLRLSYLLDYGPGSFLGRQRHTHDISPTELHNGLADCRTFLLENEARMMARNGFGRGITERDLLIFGPRGPLGNELRYDDEPARHKALDLVGDLALVGVDLAGHVIGCRSGHALNVQLAHQLREGLAVPSFRPLRLAA